MVVLGLTFAFPIVALIVPDAGSAIFATLAVTGLIFGWPASSELTRTERRLLLGFALFVAVSLLALLNTDDYIRALNKLERTARILAIIPIYLLFRRVDVFAAPIFMLGTAIGCVLMGTLAIVQVGLLDMARASGAYHKISFGDTAALFAAISVAGAVFLARPRPFRWLLLSCAVCGGLASALSGTRGAWLFALCIAGVWLVLYRRRVTHAHWVVAAIVILIGALLYPVAAPLRMQARIGEGIAELAAYPALPTRHPSWGARLDMWRDSLTMFESQPVIGVGMGDYMLERAQLMDTGAARPSNHHSHAHSAYFDALATTGALGFTALLGCLILGPLFIAFIRWRRAPDGVAQWMALCLLTTVIAFAVFGLSESWLSSSPLTNVYCLSVVVFLSGLCSGRPVAASPGIRCPSPRRPASVPCDLPDHDIREHSLSPRR